MCVYCTVGVLIRVLTRAITLVAEAGSNGRETHKYSEAILYWGCY